MAKLTPEIKDFIDIEIRNRRPLNYTELCRRITCKYGIKLCKATISKRAKALKIQFRRGRKRIIPAEKKPAHSIFLDCAGAFFLKGAELEMGLLPAMNQLLETGTEPTGAKKVLKLAPQINQFLLYASIFGLNTAREIAGYRQQGLLYLTGQRDIPDQNEIEQYERFLVDHKLLPSMIKEVTKISPEALFVRIDFAGQSFYLDAQQHTVWPSSSNIPSYFSASINKTESYINDLFQSPSAQRPLILQACPGYAFLPEEIFNLIQCFEQAKNKPISRIVIVGKSGEALKRWQDVKPVQKCFFLAPLSPWQYARLSEIRIVKDFQQYLIGPEKETMSVAEVQIKLSENISLRAALIRRKEERLALITNISPRQERYIRKLTELYFCRWPDENLKTYYELLEEAHKEMRARSRSKTYLTPLLTVSYTQKPQEIFRIFLEELHHYCLNHFFPSQEQGEDLKSMGAKFYRQSGYLKIKQKFWEVILRPFAEKRLQRDAQVACRRFNQMDIRFPGNRVGLRLSC